VVDAPRVFLLDEAALHPAILQQCDIALSASERHRLASLGSDVRRAQFLSTRYALRQCLALCHPGTHWQDWVLESRQNHPPAVQRYPVSTESHLSLSLSHSETLIAVGVSPTQIGVDIELHRKTRPWPEMLALISSAEERQRVADQSAPQYEAEFYRVWTLKEAYFKRMGSGLDWSQIRSITSREFMDPAVPCKAFALTWEGLHERTRYTMTASTNTPNEMPALTVLSDLAMPMTMRRWLYV